MLKVNHSCILASCYACHRCQRVQIWQGWRQPVTSATQGWELLQGIHGRAEPVPPAWLCNTRVSVLLVLIGLERGIFFLSPASLSSIRIVRNSHYLPSLACLWVHPETPATGEVFLQIKKHEPKQRSAQHDAVSFQTRCFAAEARSGKHRTDVGSSTPALSSPATGRMRGSHGPPSQMSSVHPWRSGPDEGPKAWPET